MPASANRSARVETPDSRDLFSRFDTFAHRLLGSAPSRYGFALLVALASGAVEYVATPSLQNPAFMLFYPAAFFVAWLAGLGPAIAYVALSLAVVQARLVLLEGGPLLPPYAMGLRMVLFGMVSIFGAWLVVHSRHLAVAWRTSDAHSRALFDQAAEGIFIADLEGRYTEVNAAGARLLGCGPGDIVGRRIVDFIPPEDEARLWRAREALLAGGTQVAEWRLRRADGAWVPVEVSAKILPDGRWQGFVRDISERLRAEEAIRRLNDSLEDRVAARTAELAAALREMESFTYSISHDLRAPLRAIDGYAWILRHEHAQGLDAEGLRMLGCIEESGLSMALLVDGLLEFSRVGRLDLQFARVDMAALVRKAAMDLEIGDGVLEVGELAGVTGDPRLLELAWRHLLANARKFSAGRERPRIAVASRVEGGEAVFEVRDNGVGFDMAYAAKLFGVFQRLHSAEEFPGTGIGLALVKRIVERHGGRAWAEGRPGEGATFSFALPLAGP